MKEEEVLMLIVDDEADICETLQDSLKLEGYQVLTSSGGNEALALFKKNKIRLVLSDIRMPAGNGVDLLKNIKAIDSEVGVFLMSGYAETTREMVLEMGAVEMIYKPFDLDDLILKLKTFIDKI
jgi:DNA-binding NtrC family response regulator